MNGRREDPDAAFAAYLRRQQKRKRPRLDVGPPPEWAGRTRRRVPGPPPDLESEERHVVEWAAMHCRLWEPRIESVKRLEAGACGYLLRGSCGGVLMLVVNRAGRVTQIGSEQEFIDTVEVLNG